MEKISLVETHRTMRGPRKRMGIPRIPNDLMSSLFQFAIEATEKAIYNPSLHGRDHDRDPGAKVVALPLSFFEKK